MQHISGVRGYFFILASSVILYALFTGGVLAAGCDAAYDKCVASGASPSACKGQWTACLSGQCAVGGNICNQDPECQMYCTEEGTSTGGKISCCSGGPQMGPHMPNPCPDKIDGKCEAKMPEMMMMGMMGMPMLPMLPMMMPKMDMPMMMPDPCAFRTAFDKDDPCSKDDKKATTTATTTDRTTKDLEDLAKKEEEGKSYTAEDTAKESKGFGSIFGSFFEGVDTSSSQGGQNQGTQGTSTGVLNTFGNAVLGQQNTSAVSQTLTQITQAVSSVAQTIATGFGALSAPVAQQLQNVLSAAALALQSLLGALGL